MKIKVNAKYTSRVANSLSDALPAGWGYQSYMIHPADKKAGPVYHQIGNIWDKRLKNVIDELIELIEAGIYANDEIDVDVLKNAKYSDGFHCFTVEDD
jgi:hypothetical protein